MKLETRIADAELKKRQQLGQFLTPPGIAGFMASLFRDSPGCVKLLDAGAGAGALSGALVRKWCNAEPKPDSITVCAYELDRTLISALEENYASCEQACMRAGIEFRAEVQNTDFLDAARSFVHGGLLGAPQTPFNAAILNPPYRKIQGDSAARLLLRSAGIETSNLYTGFLALAAKLLEDGGELVAITPRSFCNGPYFRSFRKQFLSTMSLRRIHLLESRSAAFHEDAVLQENVIIHAVKSKVKPDKVVISSSHGVPTGNLVECERAYSDIVSPNDPEQFIHLVTDGTQDGARRSIRRHSTSLHELGIEVSTGRVVDFRARDFLLPEPQDETVPLIYPCHFRDGFVRWPLAKSRKPNAIRNTEQTEELLINSGIYVLVKRFTSKEERRRIVACIYDPAGVSAEKVGFENHLNYFHSHNEGLPMRTAKGLAAYLNSTEVDSYFRQFNGHTQVNATDLRNLPYPTLDQLDRLGTLISNVFPEQAELNELVRSVLS